MRRDVTFDQYAAIRRYGWSIAPSPDGSTVAYIVNTSGQYNIWLQDVAGGCPRQLTTFTNRTVRDIRWAPDGQTIVFTADENGTEAYRVFSIPSRGGRVREIFGADGVQVYIGDILPDGSAIAVGANYREPTDQDALLVGLTDGEITPVVADGRLHFPVQISPDGTSIISFEMRDNTDGNILVADLATNEVRSLTDHEGDIQFMPAGWSADSATIYATSNEHGEFASLIAIDVATGERNTLESPDWDVEHAIVSRDGTRIYWCVNEEGYSTLYTRTLPDGETTQIDLPKGVVAAMGASDNGDILAIQLGTSTAPYEVFVYDATANEVRKLTESALGGLTTDDLFPEELIRYPSHDRDIPAWLIKPRDIDGRIPVVLCIHGGPEAQERPQYAYSGQYQYLASQGIAVLAPNVRGSTGYGKTYQTLIHRDWGGDELRDFEHAALWLREQDWVDPDRIAVYGGSFGGFATLSCVSRLPEYWACGVDVVGPSNLVSFQANVPPTWKRMLAKWVGDAETEQDFLMERSPVTYVDQIVAPLFVIQGANDPRVNKDESDQIVQKLRDRGVEVRYDVYEDEGHGFTRRENELKGMGDIVGWLCEQLLP